jgi:hypothetical protein
MTAPTPRIDYAALKSGGIIMQKDDDFYAIRLRLPGGSILADKLPKIAHVAKRYGRGEVRLTARAGIEIPWIKFKEIEAARKELVGAGTVLIACKAAPPMPGRRKRWATPSMPEERMADIQSWLRRLPTLWTRSRA